RRPLLLCLAPDLPDATGLVDSLLRNGDSGSLLPARLAISHVGHYHRGDPVPLPCNADRIAACTATAEAAVRRRHDTRGRNGGGGAAVRRHGRSPRHFRQGFDADRSYLSLAT